MLLIFKILSVRMHTVLLRFTVFAECATREYKTPYLVDQWYLLFIKKHN